MKRQTEMSFISTTGSIPLVRDFKELDAGSGSFPQATNGVSPIRAVPLLILCCTFPSISHAASPELSNADLVWIVLAGVLVFLMQAGFALIETGMSRAKNAVNVMMKNYTDVCVASLIFWAFAYGLMFSENHGGMLGSFNFGLSEPSASTYALLFFQIMFAATAATICSGAMAERTKYSAYLLSAAAIVALIYPIFGGWVWNANGWLAQAGFIDFAGSTVVHSIGAWCALAGVMVLGPRLGRFSKRTGKPREISGHNLSYVGLGGFVLWFGWFGFNAGSTLAVDSSIAKIALNTHLAASAGAIGATLSFIVSRKPVLMTGVVNGSLAGLVSITAGCATMSNGWAIVTGLIGGIVYMASSKLLLKLRIDDVVGAIPVHGFAGAWGTLAAGMFVEGDLFNSAQMIIQLNGIFAGFVWAFSCAYIVYTVLDKTIGLRSSTVEEQRGLDFTEHAEVAFPEFQTTLTYQKKS